MNTREALFSFISISLRGEADASLSFDAVNWRDLYEMATAQGVLGPVWMGMEIQMHSTDFRLSLQNKMFWHGMMKKFEGENATRYKLICDYAKAIAPLECVVLKGVDYARFWPNPFHRTFGDLDIWSNGCQQEINEKALDLGGHVVGSLEVKHNEIMFNGLRIENHRTFIDTNSLSSHRQNGVLLDMVGECFTPLTDCPNLLSPNVNFTALFMLKHLQNHFLYEGTRMRLVMDWVYFLNRERKNVDWTSLKPVMQELGIANLANFLTQYADYLRGVAGKTSRMSALEDLFFEPEMDRRLDIIHSAVRVSKRWIKWWKWHDILS